MTAASVAALTDRLHPARRREIARLERHEAQLLEELIVLERAALRLHAEHGLPGFADMARMCATARGRLRAAGPLTEPGRRFRRRLQTALTGLRAVLCDALD